MILIFAISIGGILVTLGVVFSSLKVTLCLNNTDPILIPGKGSVSDLQVSEF
jgi:hypothetical protein